MPDTDMTEMNAAIASPDKQPETAFDALCAFSRRAVGHRLFTLMTFDDETREASRIYSNMPDAYPVSGKKPANETYWSRQVIGEQRTFVANNIDAIAEVFPDFELIRSCGCESIINVPVFVAGRFLGTINCLDAAGHYTPERVTAAEAMKLPGAACFLMQKFIENGGR